MTYNRVRRHWHGYFMLYAQVSPRLGVKMRQHILCIININIHELKHLVVFYTKQ